MTQTLAALGRRADDPLGQFSPVTILALNHAKSSFLSRHAERCGYLRVIFETDEAARELCVSAGFTLKPVREWHQVDARIALGELLPGDHMPASIARAFTWLSDGVGAVEIARLFSPRVKPEAG